jgi:nucleoside-diphosphate-sugar epimerase
MGVFVAGATGAIGKQLVPRLVAAGHEVYGRTRSESKEAMLRELGAVPVVADAPDADQVAHTVAHTKLANAGTGRGAIIAPIPMSKNTRADDGVLSGTSPLRDRR